MKTILILLAFAATASAQLLPTTPLQSNLAQLSKTASATVSYAELAAQSLNANQWIWGLPDDQLAELLTAIGQQKVSELLQLQAAQATVLNAGLAAAGSSVRADVTPKREFSWSNGAAVIVPLPEPEATPNP
jgi:hypothetical protein